MAKPIRSTPKLKGKEAEIIVENMVETQKRRPNSIEIDFAKIIAKVNDI